MDVKQLHILRHSLGLSSSGKGHCYRNHFVTGEGSDDHGSCIALVESGHMVKRRGNALTGGDDLFTVTDEGRAAALSQPATQQGK